MDNFLLEENDTVARVLDYTFTIGNIVPFINTRSNRSFAEIVSFKMVDNGKIWFNGKNIKTEKAVYYPLHKSIELIKKLVPLPVDFKTLCDPFYIGSIDPKTKEYQLVEFNVYPQITDRHPVTFEKLDEE